MRSPSLPSVPHDGKTPLRGRKGIMYVAISLFFITIMAVAVVILQNPPASQAMASSVERVASMDGFLSDLEQDIDRATYIASFRSLLALEEHVSKTGAYLTDLSAPFAEAVVYGTINGTSYAILSDATVEDYASKVEQRASALGMMVTINVTHVTLTQPDPWYVAVNLTYSLNLTDSRGSASWFYTISRVTLVPITDLRDPIYSVNTLGKVQVQVKQANYTTFVNDTGNRNDTTPMQAAINQSLYHADTKAPSFLNRFLGNFSASPQGIESLVNIPQLSTQGMVINDTRSVVDYLYFTGNESGQDPTATVCHIQNLVFTPDWFKLDPAHSIEYNVTGALNYSSCP